MTSGFITGLLDMRGRVNAKDGHTAYGCGIFPRFSPEFADYKASLWERGG